MTKAVNAWIAVVGLGLDGWDGLNGPARSALARAELLVGGERHLGMIEHRRAPEAARLAWRSPLSDTLDAIEANRLGTVAVLATGDPSWFGVAKLLRQRFGPDAITVHPSLSCVQLACARLGWAVEDTEAVSLHGRPLEGLLGHLRPGARLVLLTDAASDPVEIARLLEERGFGRSKLWALELLGGAGERVTGFTAAEPRSGPFEPLHVVAAELEPDRPLSPFAGQLGFGLPDEAFEHDGQLTKREVRAVTLAALAPRPGELLWDVGAGAGSVAIEWLRAHPSLRAVAIERDPARAAACRRNAMALGAYRLSVVEGGASEVLATLSVEENPKTKEKRPHVSARREAPSLPPDAIFLGGGVAREGLAEALMDKLKPGGRLVANAVTLAGERRLLDLCGRHGGGLVRFGVERAGPIGGVSGFKPLRTVVQWRWVKEGRET